MQKQSDNQEARGGRFQRLSEWARQDVWHVDLGGVPTFKRLWTKAMRVVLITCRGFVRDQCTRHAMALTYITIFALPPFLAFVFSIAKGFGVYSNLKEGPIDSFLNENFGGEESGQVRQAIEQIFTYVEDTPLGSVATIGLLVILFAVLKLLGAVEFTLNDIWGIHRSRPLVRKVTDYLAIVTVTPVLLMVGVGLTAFLSGRVSDLFESRGESPPAAIASLDSGTQDEAQVDLESPIELEDPTAESENPVVTVDPVGNVGKVETESSLELAPVTSPLKKALLRLISTLTFVLGMAFVIFTLPNTAVRLGAALMGGLLSGLLWQLLQMGSVQVQFWLAGKSAIYSSLAAIPMLMIWIYLSWTILLAGAEVACAIQTEPVVASLARTGTVDQRLREILAPRLAVRVTAAFLAGNRAPTGADLAADLGVAPRVVSQVLDRLVGTGLLVRANDDEVESYLPGRDPATIRLQDILLALRQEKGGRSPSPQGDLDLAADEARSDLERILADSEANKSLRQLAGF